MTESMPETYKQIIKLASEGIRYNRKVNPLSRYNIFMEAVADLAVSPTKENARYVLQSFNQANTNNAISDTSSKGKMLERLIDSLRETSKPTKKIDLGKRSGSTFFY
jgi:hypothetical protein